MTTPSEQVRGPQDLVAYMNTATSEEWDKIPFPAQQQLGFHDRLGAQTINDYTGKSPEELVGSEENSVPVGDTTQLSSFVDYHLEATPPPAEPAGAPGSSGYNTLNRNVPPAKGFELDAEHELTQTTGGRVLQFEGGQDLSPEEQAKVDGVGPFIPSPVAIQAGNGDQGERYGTANGVRHGQAESFDPEAKAKSSKRGKSLSEIGEEQHASPQTASAPTASIQPVPPAGGESAGDKSEVPAGSIDKVLAWAGDDRSRAQAALDAEQAKDEPRQSLIARLNERLNG